MARSVLAAVLLATAGCAVGPDYVSNPGPGIADEHLGRIFDRFYRIDTARFNSGENHGLGLSIVKAVASMHAGTVFASSHGGMTTVGFSVARTAAPDR